MNTLRAISQLASVIDEVDQRLQLVRYTLAQTVGVNPTRAFQPGFPGIGVSPYGAGLLPEFGIGAFQNPYGIVAPHAGIQATPFAQTHVPPTAFPGAFPQTGMPGVIAPFSPVAGLGALTPPFRFG